MYLIGEVQNVLKKKTDSTARTKRQIHNFIRDSNIPLPKIDRSCRQEISKDIVKLNITID